MQRPVIEAPKNVQRYKRQYAALQVVHNYGWWWTVQQYRGYIEVEVQWWPKVAVFFTPLRAENLRQSAKPSCLAMAASCEKQWGVVDKTNAMT